MNGFFPLAPCCTDPIYAPANAALQGKGRDPGKLSVLCVSKNVTNLIVNNFYKLEPILIIFGTLC